MLTTIAYAKINFGLEVVRRRDDGFHDVVTILQEISLFDRLTFRTSQDIAFESDELTVSSETNLVLRAARALQKVAAVSRGATIRLEKSIPIGAGLGGGSSDAAATLLGLNRLWDLNLGSECLVAIARYLGSDVPFFVRGGTQLGTGRGDELRPLPTPAAWVVVLSVPESIANKTSTLYRSLRPQDFSDGRRVKAVARRFIKGDQLDTCDLVNTFERPAVELFGSVRSAFEAVRAIGEVPLLAGAGPTVLTVHPDEARAREVARRLRLAGQTATVASTVRAS